MPLDRKHISHIISDVQSETSKHNSFFYFEIDVEWISADKWFCRLLAGDDLFASVANP